ncbi:platelet binding protein GspB-like [Sycon ciliatum]|uniref:platelet binding protein GspB-like n=1 Tax=Sycon ciliatum TaxID=27933 RepID=UPI0031F67497
MLQLQGGHGSGASAARSGQHVMDLTNCAVPTAATSQTRSTAANVTGTNSQPSTVARVGSTNSQPSTVARVGSTNSQSSTTSRSQTRGGASNMSTHRLLADANATGNVTLGRTLNGTHNVQSRNENGDDTDLVQIILLASIALPVVLICFAGGLYFLLENKHVLHTASASQSDIEIMARNSSQSDGEKGAAEALNVEVPVKTNESNTNACAVATSIISISPDVWSPGAHSAAEIAQPQRHASVVSLVRRAGRPKRSTSISTTTTATSSTPASGSSITGQPASVYASIREQNFSSETIHDKVGTMCPSAAMESGYIEVVYSGDFDQDGPAYSTPPALETQIESKDRTPSNNTYQDVAAVVLADRSSPQPADNESTGSTAVLSQSVVLADRSSSQPADNKSTGSTAVLSQSVVLADRSPPQPADNKSTGSTAVLSQSSCSELALQSTTSVQVELELGHMPDITGDVDGKQNGSQLQNKDNATIAVHNTHREHGLASDEPSLHLEAGSATWPPTQSPTFPGKPSLPHHESLEADLQDMDTDLGLGAMESSMHSDNLKTDYDNTDSGPGLASSVYGSSKPTTPVVAPTDRSATALAAQSCTASTTMGTTEPGLSSVEQAAAAAAAAAGDIIGTAFINAVADQQAAQASHLTGAWADHHARVCDVTDATDATAQPTDGNAARRSAEQDNTAQSGKKSPHRKKLLGRHDKFRRPVLPEHKNKRRKSNRKCKKENRQLIEHQQTIAPGALPNLQHGCSLAGNIGYHECPPKTEDVNDLRDSCVEHGVSGLGPPPPPAALQSVRPRSDSGEQPHAQSPAWHCANDDDEQTQNVDRSNQTLGRSSVAVLSDVTNQLANSPGNFWQVNTESKTTMEKNSEADQAETTQPRIHHHRQTGDPSQHHMYQYEHFPPVSRLRSAASTEHPTGMKPSGISPRQFVANRPAPLREASKPLSKGFTGAYTQDWPTLPLSAAAHCIAPSSATADPAQPPQPHSRQQLVNICQSGHSQSDDAMVAANLGQDQFDVIYEETY